MKNLPLPPVKSAQESVKTKDLSKAQQVIEEHRIMLDCLLASIDRHLGGQESLKKDIVVDAAITAAHCRGVSVTRSCNLVHTRIKALQEQHQNRYGILRMTAALRSDGFARQPGHN